MMHAPTDEHYWLDGSSVDVGALTWIDSDPDYGSHSHMLVAKFCNIGDWIPSYQRRVLCEKP